jgi:hypothetical protein
VCLAAFWPGLIQNVWQGKRWILKWAGSPTPTITKPPTPVSELSRNALAGKLSIGPMRIGRESLPGQTNLPSAPF